MSAEKDWKLRIKHIPEAIDKIQHVKANCDFVERWNHRCSFNA